jgi:Rieske Fe-S protein
MTDDVCPSRRTVLRGVAALGVVLAPGVLVACSADGGSGGQGGSPSAGGSTAASGTVPAADVPVGQARIVEAGGQRLVVAQPTPGSYVAFSSICTHQGGAVEPEKGLVLRCPLHGSRFDAGHDGAVVNGPATEPLPSVPVRVDGDQLVLG